MEPGSRSISIGAIVIESNLLLKPNAKWRREKLLNNEERVLDHCLGDR